MRGTLQEQLQRSSHVPPSVGRSRFTCGSRTLTHAALPHAWTWAAYASDAVELLAGGVAGAGNATVAAAAAAAAGAAARRAVRDAVRRHEFAGIFIK